MKLGRRVAVTGVGAVSALGVNVAETWAGLRDGRTGVALHDFDAGPHGPQQSGVPAALAPEGFQDRLEAHLRRKVSRDIDRFALLALCAAFEALDQAGLIGERSLQTRAGVVLGHAHGGWRALEDGYERFFGRKSLRVSPATVPKTMVSAAASSVAMEFGVRGPVFSTSSACASSAHAIVQGASLIQSGLADIMIVGGSDAHVTPGAMAGWQALGVLAKEACRPFSRGRDGMVVGEGGGVLVLEALDHARARGAPLLGEYLGGGMTSDAFDITKPSLEGTSEAIRQAVDAADLLSEDQVLVSAHGTGTLLNDSNEAAALNLVFGAAKTSRPVIAPKAAHGHLLGGSAALQAVIVLEALRNGLAPPVLNFLERDPECELDLVLGAARPITARRGLVNAFGFGGLNVAMAFSTPE